MVGFSAGGHLVGSTCTNFEKRSYDAIDDVDKISCRPDFGIMCYSGYFKPKRRDGLTPTVKTPKDTPPLFFVHATDDTISDVETQRRVLPRAQAGQDRLRNADLRDGRARLRRAAGEPLFWLDANVPGLAEDARHPEGG